MFRWEDYLKIADKWLSQIDEAHLRSAISRVYYAVFCTVRERIPETQQAQTKIALRQVKGEPPGIHEVTIQCLLSHQDRTVQEMGTQLDSLRRTRNRCDYQANWKLRPREAINKVTQASALLADIKGITFS